MIEEERKCKHCGKLMARKAKKGKLESARDFRRRQFCDKKCSSLFQHSSNAIAVDADQSTPADGPEASGDQKKTAIEILEEAANNKKIDWHTRITAAKALAQYQNRKVGDTGGKKGERDEAAKKASAGRFAPSFAPKLTMVK